MFRMNVIRNLTNLTRKSFVSQQPNVVRHSKSPLSTTAVNCSVGVSPFNNANTQKSLLQVAKSITPQVRGMGTGDHVIIWKMEKILSALLVPLLPGIFIVDSQILETLLAVSIVMHVFWGFEAIIVDYLRPSVVGPMGPKIGMVSLIVVCALMIAGLCNVIWNGNGIANTVKKGWAIGKE